MQTIDLKMSRTLSEAFFKRPAQPLFRTERIGAAHGGSARRSPRCKSGLGEAPEPCGRRSLR